MDLSSVYTEIIMEHNQAKHNKHQLTATTHKERGHNPSCGDDITLALTVEDNIIIDAAYDGMGCAISQASTSMMIDLVKGKTVEEAREKVSTFIRLIKGEVNPDTLDEALNNPSE
jgi:nitrogen fixation NifU-like protein